MNDEEKERRKQERAKTWRWFKNFWIWAVIGTLFLFSGGLAGYGYRQLIKEAAGAPVAGVTVDWGALLSLSVGGGVALGLIVVALTIANPNGMRWGLGLGTVGLVLFLIFIWPTPYKYYRDKDKRLIRVHRLTGSGDYVVPDERGSAAQGAPVSASASQR